MDVKTVSIFGVTGSVGQSTEAVIASQPERFKVQAVSAHSNVERLAGQAINLKAAHAVIADEQHYGALKELLGGSGISVAAGREALLEAASMPCDVAMGAIVGFDGLLPIMRAIEQGAHVALANKEPLVAAGPLVLEAACRNNVRLLPVDSEHNAIFQVFDESQRQGIERIILTASGGPFREWSAAEMEAATPAQAVAHPNWSMGQKISVDSATLMNKALEVIEAHYLFDMPADKIDVVIHPQSVIHSMVEYADGSVLAQMGAPDMKTPIAYCLGWPDRIKTPGQRLDLNKLMRLELQPIDNNKFKSVEMAFDCLRAGPCHCVAFNAANEIAVARFLKNEIGFGDIVRIVGAIAEKTEESALNSIEAVVSFDKTVRELTSSYIDSDEFQKREMYEVHTA
ncbi:MAG: 1-deoxy-D-xylulose-5-phosphate reductoisomerase [Rhodospirillales bacterium]|nr:1-deoxy-D-xylulose-5-phosphate reductoisomerase [Rhodospirillales bacterium]MCB9995618.1 1-deoxy-D-xylulose-5-phosphate reductoisomerase [Rhodospirillales bacterium]